MSLARLASPAVRVATVLAYFARPWSCLEALSLEVRPPGQPNHSVDPHGFGALGAVLAALIFAFPVLWLLLRRWPEGRVPATPRPVRLARAAAVVAVLGSPMLMQLSYRSLPLAAAWPIYTVSIGWAVLVAALCLGGGRTVPGAQPAFDGHPRLAWGVVALIAAAKLAFVVAALAA